MPLGAHLHQTVQNSVGPNSSGLNCDEGVVQMLAWIVLFTCSADDKILFALKTTGILICLSQSFTFTFVKASQLDIS